MESRSEADDRRKMEQCIVRDMDQVNRMVDDARLISGRLTTEQLKEMQQLAASSDPVDPEDVDAQKIVVPKEHFEEYKEVGKHNEKEFDYMIGSILIAFLEKRLDKALEFPSVISSDGRARIHALATFLGKCILHSQ